MQDRSFETRLVRDQRVGMQRVEITGQAIDQRLLRQCGVRDDRVRRPLRSRERLRLRQGVGPAVPRRETAIGPTEGGLLERRDAVVLVI